MKKEKKNGQVPTSKNPKGAGRPRKEGADPSRQSNAPPPPADPSVTVKESAKKSKTIKVTPALAEQLGRQIAMAESIPYAVMARAKEDDRWLLDPAEIDMLANVWTTTIIVYADEIGRWIPLVAVMSANVAPLVARLMMGELPKKADVPGANATKEDRKKAA